jgi:hypothetical protein
VKRLTRADVDYMADLFGAVPLSINPEDNVVLKLVAYARAARLAEKEE